MKSKKLLSLSLATAIVAGIVSGSGADLSLLSNAADDTGDDWLHAVGSRLYDMNGNEVWLTGANWFGFNCSENCAHGLYATDVDVFLSSCADKGINVIRFPISSELLLSWMNGEPDAADSVQAGYEPPVDELDENGNVVTPAGTYVNINKDFVLEDGKTLKNSMEIFDIIMQKCKDYGIKAFVDIHSPDANNSGHNYELWYGKAGITTELWIETLVWLADKYKNDDTLLGYDLKNEPHGKREYDATCPDTIAKWDDSTDENNWAYAATTCANAILAVNPNALIFVEGVEQYPKTEKGYTYDTPDIWQATAEQSPWYGAWWGGNLRGVRDYPITPTSGTSQIVYSPHDYGPSVYAQTWFDKDFDTQSLLDDYWYDTWAYINAEDIAPLLIGEWGGHMDGDKNQKWMELLRDYMINNHINHTFWCLNPNSGDTGGLLGYDFITWDDEKYALFEPSLWQTLETGKYIGLDHQKALGNNGTGISLNDFYANYAHTEGSNLDGGTILDSQGSIVTGVTTTQPADTTSTVTTDLNYGDINVDGEVTIADVILCNRHVAEDVSVSISTQGIANADVTGDDKVNSEDAVKILQYIALLITYEELCP